MIFELTTTGEYAKVQGGYAFKSKDFSESGICPVLKIKNVRFGYIDYSDTSFIDSELAQETSDWETKEGDILISMTGSGPNAPQSLVGRVARVWENEPKAWINQRVGRIVVKDKKLIHPDFIFYLLSAPRSQEFLVSNSSGSANQANISKTTIESLPCPRVSYKQSEEIAKILRKLDNKIQLNRQTNQTLEQIAQAIFKSWFVDFEPVKAKIAVLAEGGSAEQAELAAMCVISAKDETALKQLQAQDPDNYQQLAQTAALFPSAMQESELGNVPKGWAYGKLSDISTYANERVAVSELTLENYISTENMIESKKGVSKASSFPSVNTVPMYRKGQTLISNIRPYFKKIWLASFEGGRSADVLGFESATKGHQEFLYNLLYQDEFFDYMMRTSKGVKMPRGDKTAIMNFDACVPCHELTSSYSEAVRGFYRKIENLNKENTSLAMLRDTLLPKLLSGEIDLSQVQEASNEVSA